MHGPRQLAHGSARRRAGCTCRRLWLPGLLLLLLLRSAAAARVGLQRGRHMDPAGVSAMFSSAFVTCYRAAVVSRAPRARCCTSARTGVAIHTIQGSETCTAASWRTFVVIQAANAWQQKREAAGGQRAARHWGEGLPATCVHQSKVSIRNHLYQVLNDAAHKML